MRYIISFLLTSAALPVASLPAMAEVPRVVTDVPAIHSLAAQVMGDLGAPALLLDRGADPHAFQLRPSQARELEAADLVLWIGPEMTPWLTRPLESLGSEARAVALLGTEGTHRQDFGAGTEAAKDDHGHDHGHDHAVEATAETAQNHSHDAAHGHEGEGHNHEGHTHESHGHEGDAHEDHAHEDHAHGDHGHDHGHEGHAHTGLDPHAYLDPANGQHWARVIAAELAALDPANAATYTANAEAAASAIAALDAELASRLAPLRGQDFVVFHDAYGYFTAHYGLNPALSVALGDAASPGAARIAALRDRVEGSGTICLFPEAQHDPALITQLAEGTGAKIGPVLDPSGSTLEPGAGAYAALLTGLADGLAACMAN